MRTGVSANDGVSNRRAQRHVAAATIVVRAYLNGRVVLCGAPIDEATQRYKVVLSDDFDDIGALRPGVFRQIESVPRSRGKLLEFFYVSVLDRGSRSDNVVAIRCERQALNLNNDSCTRDGKIIPECLAFDTATGETLFSYLARRLYDYVVFWDQDGRVFLGPTKISTPHVWEGVPEPEFGVGGG